MAMVIEPGVVSVLRSLIGMGHNSTCSIKECLNFVFLHLHLFDQRLTILLNVGVAFAQLEVGLHITVVKKPQPVLLLED